MSMRTQFLIMFWACVALVIAPLGAEDQKPLRFVGNHNLPPMLTMSDSGPKGLVVDLAHEIIKAAGLNAQVEAMDWGTAQGLLKSGSIDALLQITSNPERLKVFDFSEPLLLSELSIFRHIERIDIQDIKLSHGRKVGVEGRGASISIIRQYPDIEIEIIPNWEYGLRKVSQGDLDAVIVDGWVGSYELAKHGISNVVNTEKPIDSSFSMIAVQKGNDDLLAAINDGIRRIRGDGTYDRVLANWKSAEVVYLTRGDQFRYGVWFLIIICGLILSGSLVYIRRITRANRAQSLLNKRLEERNDELLQFAYRTSHDLKSPLTSSKQLLNFIQKDIDSGDLPEATRNVQLVHRKMEKLENLVTTLLDMSSAEFKEHEYEEIDFKELFAEIEERSLFNIEGEKYRLEFVNKLVEPTSLPRARVVQIIENLISNGVKYRKRDAEDSHVMLTISREGDDIRIVCQDNGLGIPK